ncbi:MAG: MFS transporter [Anaerolineales bacterium]|nr:MFS transporter [Anaerolineales bacterium]
MRLDEDEYVSMTMRPTDRPATRWFVLGSAALTSMLALAMPAMALPVLFSEMSEDLGLSLVQIGLIWGSAPLAGMFSGVFAGLIGDRFGANRTVLYACILMSIAGALRGFANNFYTLAIGVLLYGFLTPALPANLSKVCGTWFSGKRLGMANGVVSLGMAFGFMSGSLISASVLSPWLGGWRNVIFFYGAVTFLVGFIWRFIPNGPADEKVKSIEPGIKFMRQSLSQLLRLKNVWLLGLAMVGIGGCFQGVLGYLPLYLRKMGWNPAVADSALATFHAMSMVSVIPITLLSDKLGKRKRLLIYCCLSTALGAGLLFFVQGSLVWGAVILTGMVRDAYYAILITMVTETEGIGPELTGTAMGIILLFSKIGGLVAPPAGNSLAEIELRLPFLLWSAMAASSFVVFHFVQDKKNNGFPGLTDS